MYGKFFASAFTGSMFGAGTDVFAVWAYVIANAVNGSVEVNPLLVAAILGTTPERVEAALYYLTVPDPSSRSQAADGRRLVREGGYQYSVVNHTHYRMMRNEDDRRAYNRDAQRRFRERKKTVIPPVIDSQSLSTLSAEAEAEAEADTEAEVRTPLPPKGGEVTPKTKTKALVKVLDDGFDRFWSAYPLKKAKVAARRSWAKHAPDGPLVDAIVAAIEQQTTWRPWREGFIPLPATWLNQERWNDEPEPARENPKSRTAGNADALRAVLARRRTE